MIQVITYSKSQEPFLFELEDSRFLDSLIKDSELKLLAPPVYLKSNFKKDNNDFSIEKKTLISDPECSTYSIKIRDGFLPDELIKYLAKAVSIRNSDGEQISFKEFLALLKN